MPVEKPVMDGYIRVSQVAGRQGDRFQSPDTQRDAIEGWAKAHGVRVAMIHEDLDRSGGTMDRPGMRTALKRIADGHSRGIIVAKLDRFARTVSGGLQTIYSLHEQGARVVSVAESIDPATPLGRAMLGLLLIMAEWQRDQADEALSLAQRKAAAAGRYAIRTPFGYRRDSDGKLEPDPKAAAILHRVFSERADGVGWRKIADDLTRDGIATPAGHERWAHSTVMGLVQSESPLGMYRGARGMADVPEAWEPVVSRELWEAANRVGGLRDNDRRHHDRLLAGVARCSGCRGVLRRTVNQHGHVSYGCVRRGCPGRASIGAELLDGHVTGLVDERLAGIGVERTEADDIDLAELVAAAEAAAVELEQWRDDTELREVIGNADYRQGLMERARVRDGADRALSAYRSHRHSGLALVANAPEAGSPRLADFGWDDRRRIVEAYLHSVWVRRSSERGPRARQLVAHRVLVVWADDREPPAVPTARAPQPGPLVWPGGPST